MSDINKTTKKETLFSIKKKMFIWYRIHYIQYLCQCLLLLITFFVCFFSYIVSCISRHKFCRFIFLVYRRVPIRDVKANKQKIVRQTHTHDVCLKYIQSKQKSNITVLLDSFSSLWCRNETRQAVQYAYFIFMSHCFSKKGNEGMKRGIEENYIWCWFFV